MTDLIQAHVFENVGKHRQAFMDAKPYRHLVIDNFYTDETLRKLLEEFPSHASTDSIISDYGTKNAKKVGAPRLSALVIRFAHGTA